MFQLGLSVTIIVNEQPDQKKASNYFQLSSIFDLCQYK